MSIRNYFKKTRKAEIERQKSLRDPDQVLAWLEELSRLGTQLELAFSGGEVLPVHGVVETVDEAAGVCTVRVQWKPAEEPTHGQRVATVFPMDDQRFQTDLVFQARGNYMEYRFSLPTSIHHAERRDSVRVKMLAQDKFNIVVLQGLGEGLGLSGQLVDVSMGGCCFLLQRAIRIHDEGRLAITPDLLAPGAPLALVRLPDLPDLPQVECGGYVCYMREVAQGVIAGLRFESLGAFETGILGKFLSERIPGFSYGFPHKRRTHELSGDELEVPQPPSPVEAFDDQVFQADALDEPNEDDPATAGVGAELKEALTEQDRRTRLRKRGKKILLVMGDELERMLFMAMLHQDGYRCLFEARSLVQALNHHRKVPIDLLVVDQAIGHMDALNLVEVLRDKGLPREVPVLVMRRDRDVSLTLAAKAGKVNLLVDRPVDFAGKVKQPIEDLFGLEGAGSA